MILIRYSLLQCRLKLLSYMQQKINRNKIIRWWWRLLISTFLIIGKSHEPNLILSNAHLSVRSTYVSLHNLNLIKAVVETHCWFEATFHEFIGIATFARYSLDVILLLRWFFCYAICWNANNLSEHFGDHYTGERSSKYSGFSIKCNRRTPRTFHIVGVF